MPEDFTENEYFRADAVAHLQLTYGDKYQDIVNGLLFGIQLHSADPAKAIRLYDALTIGGRLTVQGVVDQLAATMHSSGNR